MKQKIRQILSQRKKQVIVDGSSERSTEGSPEGSPRRLTPKLTEDKQRTPAAVLLLLFEKEGQYYVLFTQRTQKVEYHKGQISFPGGACDEEDENSLATALRETYEEIGVRSEDIEILGELDDMATVSSNFVISPFVGTIPYPYEFKVNEDEIEELLEVPLLALLDKTRFKEGSWEFEGKSYFPVYFYEYEGHVIWGATARILKQFLDLIGGAH